MVRLTLVLPSQKYMSVKCRIIGGKILKILKKAISNFNWNKAFENLAIDEQVALLNQALLNIFRNFIPKKNKCGYQQLPWMTNETKNLLKERPKLTEYFYGNGQWESDCDKVLEKPA